MLGHNRKMTGAECLAEMLKGYGVTHVFHGAGGAAPQTFAEMERRTDIKRHPCAWREVRRLYGGRLCARLRPARHLHGAGDRRAQSRGRLARRLARPFAGDRHDRRARAASTKFRKVYQEIDDMPAFEPVTKFNATVDDVARFPDMVRQAFRVAVSGTPGPVHLQFRGNEGQVDAEEAEMEPLVRAAVRARAAVPARAGRSASMLAALAHLQEAERPVIVAGGGVRASGAAAELVALARGAANSGRDLAQRQGHDPRQPSAVGRRRRHLFARERQPRGQRADLVCFIGTETGGMTTHFWAVPPIGTPAIQIDIDPEALGRNYPLGRRRSTATPRSRSPACSQHADRGSAGKRKRLGRGGAGDLRGMADKYRAAACLRRGADPARAHLRASCRGTCRTNAIVVVDTGHAGMWMGGMYDLTSPRQSYIRSAGHLGWAFPAGLGAKCGVPERPVVTFTGDAGFWYHIARGRDRGALEDQRRHRGQQ